MRAHTSALKRVYVHVHMHAACEYACAHVCVYGQTNITKTYASVLVARASVCAYTYTRMQSAEFRMQANQHASLKRGAREGGAGQEAWRSACGGVHSPKRRELVKHAHRQCADRVAVQVEVSEHETSRHQHPLPRHTHMAKT